MKRRQRDAARGSDYLSYLLRLWQESDEATEGHEAPVWRASLTSPATGERVGFASLKDLIAYLQERIGSEAEGVGVRHGSPENLEGMGWSIRS